MRFFLPKISRTELYFPFEFRTDGFKSNCRANRTRVTSVVGVRWFQCAFRLWINGRANGGKHRGSLAHAIDTLPKRFKPLKIQRCLDLHRFSFNYYKHLSESGHSVPDSTQWLRPWTRSFRMFFSAPLLLVVCMVVILAVLCHHHHHSVYSVVSVYLSFFVFFVFVVDGWLKTWH